MNDKKPTRHGRTWDLEEYADLVDLIREGLTLDEVSDRLERTSGAVAARSEYLIPGFAPGQSTRDKSAIFDEAQALLTDDDTDDYDWFETLRENLQTAGSPLWDGQTDSILRSAWAGRAPALDDLAMTLDTTVASVVRRCVDIGLGTSSTEVRSRFGMVEAQVATPLLPWTLLITTEAGRVFHVNRHQSQWDAALERDFLIPSIDDHLDVSVTWRWEIVFAGDPAEVPEVSSRGAFYPAAGFTLGSEFIDEQLKNGGFKIMWGNLEARTPPVVMCPPCAANGLWNTEMHALASAPQNTDDHTDIFFRCLRGHVETAHVANDTVGEWVEYLPRVPEQESDTEPPPEAAQVHGGDAAPTEIADGDYGDDDIDITDEDLT